jgi:AraC family transcriptional regulator
MKLPSGHYSGAVLEKTEVAGLRLLESEYRPGVQLPKHSHASAFFSVLLHGAVTENYSKRTLHCWKPLSFCFDLADEEHTTRVHETGARFLIIEVSSGWLERARESSGIFHRSTVVQSGSLTSLAARLHREVQQPDQVSPLAIEGIVLEMIAEASRENRATEHYCPGWLKQARELIHSKYNEPLSLSSIGKSVGVHPVYLARVFQRFEHRTIGEYIRQLRIEEACRELRSSDRSLSAIAAAAGFFDQSHFCRIFRQHISMTPTEYRRLFHKR